MRLPRREIRRFYYGRLGSHWEFLYYRYESSLSYVAVWTSKSSGKSRLKHHGRICCVPPSSATIVVTELKRVVMDYDRQTSPAKLSSGVGPAVIQKSVRVYCMSSLVRCAESSKLVAESLRSVRWV